MKIVVAVDSFKGSATSSEIGTKVKEAIHSILPECQVEKFSIADGGEGTLDALSQNIKGRMIEVTTIDLLQRPINASYFLAGKIAFIESAQVIGIDKIIPSPHTFQNATSLGLGALIRDAADRGCREIILTLGGTGTSDGGIGLLKSLDFDFEDNKGSLFLRGKNIRITGLADVKNYYAGNYGYAKIFGPQKGGTTKQIEEANEHSYYFVKKMQQVYDVDLQKYEGTGAAGGLGGAIVLLNGQIKSGFSTIADIVGLTNAIKDADLVITGEGKLDSQSKEGKVPIGVAHLAKINCVPVIALCGSIPRIIGDLEDEFLAIYSIQKGILTLEEAMKKETTLSNIYCLVRNIIRTRYL